MILPFSSQYMAAKMKDSLLCYFLVKNEALSLVACLNFSWEVLSESRNDWSCESGKRFRDNQLQKLMLVQKSARFLLMNQQPRNVGLLGRCIGLVHWKEQETKTGLCFYH